MARGGLRADRGSLSGWTLPWRAAERAGRYLPGGGREHQGRVRPMAPGSRLSASGTRPTRRGAGNSTSWARSWRLARPGPRAAGSPRSGSSARDPAPS